MKDIVIFSLSNNKELTEKVCKKLKIKKGEVNIKTFADGEVLTQAIDSVRGKEVYIIQSTSNPVNSNIMELLIFIDSLKRASATKITAIIPYFGYSRQDRKATGRQPITAKLVANLISTSGADKVITFDLHAPQIQGFFDIPTDNLKGLSVIKNEVKKLKLKNVVVASPDYGGIVRARELALKFGKNTPIAMVDKIRFAANQSKINKVFGEIKNKNVVLVDDMIDTGGTISKAADEFKKMGAKKVIVACTHPVFSNDAAKKLATNKSIDIILVTDSIELKKEQKHKKIKVISLSGFVADVIKADYQHKSITSIYTKYDK